MPAHRDQSYLARVVQNPLLLAPNAEQQFLQSMNAMVASEHFEAMMANSRMMEPDDEFWEPNGRASAFRPYIVRNGILQIPVSGVLLNRFSFQFGRWATGYQYIERAFNRGMDDPDVRGIAFVIDSPGGEVAGNFELVDKIYAARGRKPVRAFAEDHAYSAAYSIASVADNVTVTRSGGVGSIGVLTAHVDYSESLAEAGVKVTFVFAGKHKVDGNPYEKLPASVKARMQERIDHIYDEFVSLVARNRNMDERAIRDTEALTFDATKALDVGLADKVGAMEEELVIFSEEAEPEDELMSGKNNHTPAAENEGSQITQAMLDSAVEKAHAEGVSEGVTAERARMNGILALDAAKTRPAAAMAAVEEGLSVEVAERMLSKLPEESAEAAPEETPRAATNPFNEAMNATGNPEVGAEAGSTEDESWEADSSAEILRAFGTAVGKVPAKRSA